MMYDVSLKQIGKHISLDIICDPLEVDDSHRYIHQS